MLQFKKILCTIDFTEQSEDVVKYAYSLAKQNDATVIVLYVATPLSQYVGFHMPHHSAEDFVNEIIEAAQSNMKEFIDKYFNDVDTEGRIVAGFPAEEILSIADKEKVDIIVMGTHGRKGIDRILFGSVAEKVVKNANQPVLTIRPTTVPEENDD